MAINSLGYNTQRISGLFSGMDTQTLVTNMLAADQAKIDNVFRQQEKAQWKLDAYSELNSAVSSLRDTYLSVLGEKSLIKNAAYNHYNVTMSENSSIKITGTASAMATNFQILSATRATSARAAKQLDSSQTEIAGRSLLRAQTSGSLTLADGQTIDEGTTLGDLAGFEFDSNDSLSFSINGEVFTFTKETTLGDMQAAINESENAAATMTIDYASGAVSLKSDTLGKDSALVLSNNTGKAFGEGFGIEAGAVAKSNLLDKDNLGTTTFSELANALDITLSGNSFTVNDTTVQLMNDDGTEKSIQDVMDELDAADYTMLYNENTGSFTIRNKSDGSADSSENAAIKVSGALFGENSIMGVAEGTYQENGGVKRSDTLAEVARKLGANVEGNTYSFSINGVDFSFDMETTTINDVMTKVNSDPNAKAVFSYSEMTDSFEIRSAETGKSAALEISGMEDLFGLSTVQDGTDATLQVSINGTTRTIEQASNNFTLDGLNFEILNDYNTPDPVTGEKTAAPINVNVERDYQPTIDTIKSFIEDYNKVIEALNTKYYEQSYRAYQPLTEDERAAITEDEAAKWDEKAMSGVLRNDSTIGNLLTNLRQSLSVKVGDTGMSAFDLGISTVAWGTDSWRTKQGQLVLDEEKLLAALKEDPAAVQKVLSGISEDGEVSTSGGFSESGLLVRMNEFMRGFNTTMRTQNIQNTTKDIADYAEKMTDMLVKMSEKEEKYYAKYSAMETMLAEMQSQQQWLSSMFGTSTN